MKMNKLELGAIIRKRRKELGLTLNDLAGDRISVPTISNIERGMIGNVSDDKLDYITERLGLTEAEFAKITRQTDDEKREIKRRLSIAKHLIRVKCFEKARKELADLENENGLNDYPHFMAEIQLRKGILYRKMKQWQRAKNSLEKTIRLVQEANVRDTTNIVAEAYYYISICVFYGDQDYEQANEYADSALDSFHEDGQKPYLKGQIVFQKALCYFHLERYGHANKFVLEAIEISRRHRDIRLLVYEYNLEALIHKRQQLYKDAAQSFEKAIAVAEEFYPEPWEASLLYLNLGDMNYCMQKYDQALHYYNIATELSQKTKDEDILATLYINYAEVYYETGEYEKAAKYINQAFELKEHLTLSLGYLSLLLLKAQIALGQGLDEVQAYCQEGIRLAEKNKMYNKVKDFHLIMAKYFDEKGREDQYLREAEKIFQIECLMRGEGAL